MAGFAFLAGGIVLLALNNLGNRYFWTDESSSLYTSLGWPGVGEESGSLAGAWDWTMRTHVEPGLYNMLERYWALGFGTEIMTLRAYPFMFFLVYLASLVGLGRLVRLPWFLIAGVIGLVLLENITPYYTVELRPSSAGLAASAAIPLITLLLIAKPRWWMFALFLAVFGLIGSMQFNSYPLEAAAGVVLIAFGLLQRMGSERLFLVLAGLFAIAWLPTVYVTTRGNPLSVAQEPGLDAISDLLIPNMDTGEVLRLLQQNLLSFTAAPRTVFLILVPLLWVMKRWAMPHANPAGRVNTVNQLWVFVSVATCATASIGFLGVMPWIVGTRWSIAEIGLIALSLLGLAAIAVELGVLRVRLLAAAAVVASVVFAGLAGYRLATYERFPGHDWGALFPTMLEGEPGKLVIDTEVYTGVRYWIELSGDYDLYRKDWVTQRAQTTSDFDKADVASIEAFLASDNDRLLLGDSSLLERSGITLPQDVQVVEVRALGKFSGLTPPTPVLLIKES